MVYQTSLARDEILSGLSPHDIFRLGQIYEMMRNNKYFTASEWNSFLSFYVNNQRFRESFVNNYIKPTDQPHLINLHDAQTAEIFDQQSLLQRGKLYFDTFAILEEYKSISIPEETQSTVIASLFTVYPGEKYSAEIETAILDHGKDVVPLLLKGAENIGKERAERILKRMVAVENEKILTGRFTITADLPEIAPITIYLIEIMTKATQNIRYSIAEAVLAGETMRLFEPMAVDLINSTSSSYTQIVHENLFTKLIGVFTPTDTLISDIIYFLSYQAAQEEKTILHNSKTIRALLSFFSRASLTSIKSSSHIIDKEMEKLEEDYSAGQPITSEARKTNLIVRSLFILIQNIFRSALEITEKMLKDAKEAAETLLRFALSQKLKATEIAYLPGFIAARIPGEYREKAVDEIKRAIEDDHGRDGIYLALNMVQNILGPEIYTALGKAYKDLKMSEHYPEALIYADIIKETNRLEKLRVIMEAIKENKELWMGIITLISHDKFEDARQIIAMILNRARDLNREQPFDKNNLDNAIGLEFNLIDQVIFDALKE
jgi:hypothetical protein